MAKFRMNRQSLRRLFDRIDRRNERLQRKIVNALVIWADDTVGEIKAELIRIGALDTGDLAGSVTRTPPKLRGRKRIGITIFSSKEYASIIELGRRARSGKRPPLEPIIAWGKRKGIIKHLPTNVSLDGPLKKKLAAAYMIRRNAKRKSGGKKKSPIEDGELKDLLIAVAIQDAIWRKGIKGRKPFSRVWDKRRRTFTKEIVRMVQF